MLTLSFLSKQIRRGRNIVSFHFFSFISRRAKCLSREQYVESWVQEKLLCAPAAVCISISNGDQQFWMKLDCKWVVMLMKGPKIPRIELNTVQLYQHYSLFMLNTLQYAWRGDYCECVRPAQLPVSSSSFVPPGTPTIRSPPAPRRVYRFQLVFWICPNLISARKRPILRFIVNFLRHSWIKIDQLDVTALLLHCLLLNMFRMLVHSSSGACDLFVELSHGLYCSGSMCVGVTVWFGWGGVVSLRRLRH